MNNKVLQVIAGLLALGSVIVAFLGYRLSQEPKTVSVSTLKAPATAPTEVVVVAARGIRSGHALSPADLATKGVAVSPIGSFKQTQELIGKVSNVDIPAGTVLTSDRFANDSMASQLRIGERAVAVHIDEVVGVGGYIRPGDHVDVLFYMAASRESGDKTLAQVTIHDARLLSVGDISQMDKQEDVSTADKDKNKQDASSSVSKEIKERRQNQRSAVLAIQESEATKLMLAASTGQVRLALRPQAVVQPDPLSIYSKGQRQSASLQTRRVSLSELVQQKPTGTGGIDTDSGIIIQEGSKERRLTQNELRTQQ
jgi:pilus assembly protein CpaB